VFGLPFHQVWAADFEFRSTPGVRPEPLCLVARELGSGRLLRLWRDELPPHPPFSVDEHTLFVAYYGPAEWSCFLELGWPLPVRIIDLYAEFRAETNGLALPAGRGLLGALGWHGLASITKDEKHDMRSLVLRGGPWSSDERAAILDYCQSDVDCLGPLLERMLPRLRTDRRGLGQALLRGRYSAATARMEHTGVPIDVPTLARLRAGWDDIKLDLIRVVDRDYGVYDGTVFKAGLFAAWLADRGIAWPRTATGRLHVDQDTFRDMAKLHPELEPLKELRSSLSEMRLEDLAVGPDGRNRTLLSPFRAATGRNQPSNTRFIFGPAVWLRGLIKPGPGRALAYVDWASQEVAIAAALSGDEAMIDAVQSGDPYLAFAVRAGLAPADATKQSHGALRDACKVVVLGTNYGMGAQTLAARLGCSVLEAKDLLRRLAKTFPEFWAWAEHVVDVGMLSGRLSTVFGWPVHVTDGSRPTALRNFPMQANGAEMLRLACCLTTERGVDVCAPVHDALLIEAADSELSEVVTATRKAMAEASAAVLGGMTVATDVAVVAYPDRYLDPSGRGRVMWARAMELLSRGS
jgi:DNA polymerase I